MRRVLRSLSLTVSIVSYLISSLLCAGQELEPVAYAKLLDDQLGELVSHHDKQEADQGEFQQNSDLKDVLGLLDGV